MPVFKYAKELKKAILFFWEMREGQFRQQQNNKSIDHGLRGAVTGGKQLDGFIDLLTKVSVDVGIPKECIYRRGNELPGFFRPTKDWDFLIISPKGNLVACIELKSQVGSFGNNFNNRVEEALGNAIDIWTAFREKAFNSTVAPWIGYLIVVEKAPRSSVPIRVSEPHFKVFPEFRKTSYLERYQIFCKKLVLEKMYSASSLIWTSNEPPKKVTHGYPEGDLSFERFIDAYLGYLSGRLKEFKQ